MKKQKFLSLMLSISMVLSMASTTSLALESDDASRNGKEVLQVSELPKNKNQELNMEEVVAKDTAIPDMEDKATEPVNKSGASSLESEKLSAPTDVVDIPDKEFAKKIKYQLNKPENHKITRSDMEQLKSLVINFGNLENKIEDLEGIQYATNLKSLLIDGDCKNIEKIKGLKNLTHLNLDSVLTFNFSILESMPNLIDLSIDSIPTFNFSMLDSMPNLIKIDLFQIENLQNLNGLTKEKFPKLETLVCSRCKNLEDISALKGQNFPLKKVDFEGYNKISDITPLTGYTSIEELDLEKVTIKDQNRVAYKNTVRSLTGLKVLNMLYCKVTDADVDMFYPLKNLKSLLLNMNKITNTKFCDNLPKDMEALGLHGNKIKNMDNLARFDKLKNLGMGDNSVTDFGFAKSLKNLTSDGIRHSEGSERFPCKQYYRIGEFDHPIENDGDLVVKNPYKDIDGNVIPFENIKSNDDNPTYTVEYNKETNEVTFHNLDGTAYIYVDYDMPVSNGEVKKFKLYIAAYVTKAAVYTVNYDWGKSAPANVTLPKDNEKYNSLYEAKKAVDTTFTKETEVKDTVDGVKGVWKFSGWEVNVRGKEVLCTGNWKFYPDMIAVNEVPKITATDKTLTVGDKFDERDGITAKDYKGQDLTDQIVVLKNEVDTTKAGTYKVTYKVTDKRGASVQKSITVIVNPKAEVINQVPSIEAKDKVLMVGDKFDERDGITAKDYKGQDLTDQIVVLKNEVDTTKAGTYKVTYKVTDKRGASVQKSITVIVNPKAEIINQVPSIEAKDKVLTVGDKFDELEGITAKDYKGQDLTDQIVVLKNEVDTTKAGTYKVTYKVTDKRGASVQKSITVIVNPKAEVINPVPSIEAKDKVLTVGDKFDERDGITAKDYKGQDLTDQIVVLKNEVDTTKAGTYEVVYKVTDKHGSSMVKTIKITVKEKSSVPVKPGKPVKPVKTTVPKTGDSNTFGFLGMTLLVSSGIMALLSKKKRFFK